MGKNQFICDCNMVHEEAVREAMKSMPSEKNILAMAELYKIMGDATRCKILSTLQEQALCVCDLCNVLSMSKSSVSHQLAKMRQVKALKCERKGKEVYYSLEDSHIRDILMLTRNHIEHEGA